MTGTIITGIQPQWRTIDGLSIRYAESEPRDTHALLLSPWPESIYAFEPTWARLAQQAHLVAIDLPGFGQSERRDALMSPSAMGEFLIRVADAFELEQPHVIGPDIGTSASLFAAAQLPGRFRSLVIGSGGASFPLELTSVLKEWALAPDLEPYRQVDGRHVISAVMATLERYQPTAEAREDYLRSYEGTRFAESIRYVQTYPTQLALLRDLLPTIQTPVQIIAGRRDAVVPTSNAEYLHRRLPASRLELIDAGHFTWEDTASEYAELVTTWWTGGYSHVRKGGTGR
jgi:pimeloyl-ACP methyl ester carboxylesterase